jgi:hypothetical protein
MMLQDKTLLSPYSKQPVFRYAELSCKVRLLAWYHVPAEAE